VTDCAVGCCTKDVSWNGIACSIVVTDCAVGCCTKDVSWNGIACSVVVTDCAVGCCFVYKQQNDVHKSSSLEVYYQCSVEQTHNNMLLELFSQIISEPCFDILRTQEQLGIIITLRSKLSGAVYCNWSCLWVCLCVCGSVTMITRNCVHRSLPNWVCR